MNPKIKAFSLATLLALLSSSSKAQEVTDKDNSPEASSSYLLADASFTNKNMFFGMNFGTIPLIQPYIEAGNKNITLSTWLNYDINKPGIIEADFLVAYKAAIKVSDKHTLTLQPGFMYLTFPNQDPSAETQWPDFKEVSLKATLAGMPVDFYIRAGKVLAQKGFVTNDIDDGSMIAFNASKSAKLFKEKVSIAGSLETIYNSNYFSGAKGFSHASATGAVSFSPLENVTMTLSGTTQKKISDKMDCVLNESYFKAGITYIFK